MKHRMINLVLGLTFILCAATAGAAEADKKESPVSSPAPLFTFEKTVEGTEILHDFVIRNNGKAAVDVQRVKTG